MESKLKKYRFNVLNIKMRTSEDDKENGYIELFKKIHSEKISIKIIGDNHTVVRTCFQSNTVNGDIVLYGKLSKYTKIEGNDWLNLKNMETETIDLPEGTYPNFTETDYFFFPSIHRIAILANRKISINTAYNFFKNAINKVVEYDEMAEIAIETSNDFIEKIINAKKIERLEIAISYSNSDNYDYAAKAIDDELKNSNVNDISIVAKPDLKGNIDIEKSNFFMGILELCQSNGRAKATIRDAEDKRQVVDTSQYPKEFNVQSLEVDNLKFEILSILMDYFRRNEND